MLRFTNIDYKSSQFQLVNEYQTHPLLSLQQALDSILSRIHGLDHFIEIATRSCRFPSDHGLTRDESAAIYIYTMDWGDESLYRLLNEAVKQNDRLILIPCLSQIARHCRAEITQPRTGLVVWC
jgi:hypothetical protein